MSKKWKKSGEDNNIFFTAITLYTLNSLRPDLPVEDQVVIDSLYNRATSVFKYYKNRNGDITYNFYPVRPEHAFPSVKMLSKTRLPDDLDDTSMLYLIQKTNDSLNVALKRKMVNEVYDEKKVKSTYKAYRKSIAYRTWFAKKMNQDIDICVNSNVLAFVFQKGISMDTVDRASIDLIKIALLKNQHLQQPHLIAPHYQNSSIILYHIARLIPLAKDGELNEIREKVAKDLKAQLLLVKNDMEKVILLSSLYRLGEKIEFSFDLNHLKHDMYNFYWCTASLSSGRAFWVKKIIGEKDFLIYRYKCEAYYWTLVLELEILSGHVLKRA